MPQAARGLANDDETAQIAHGEIKLDPLGRRRPPLAGGDAGRQNHQVEIFHWQFLRDAQGLLHLREIGGDQMQTCQSRITKSPANHGDLCAASNQRAGEGPANPVGSADHGNLFTSVRFGREWGSAPLEVFAW